MVDSGKRDEKIIALPFGDPTYKDYTDIEQLPSHIFDEMRHFFTVYKSLEGKKTAVDEVQGHEAAIKIVKECIENYKIKFGD